MLQKIILFILFFSGTVLYSQTYKLTGRVTDLKNNKLLGFATIKIADTAYGTVADESGEYILHLKKGIYKIIASYIGYFSDTVSIEIFNGDYEKNIYLKPTNILTETINVYGEDPSYEIIRKAIRYKRLFKSRLNEYEYDAYSKFIIRTNFGQSKNDSIEEKTGKENIFALLESETKGYFKKPDLEKQIVRSKRESANIMRGFALPLIVNFYDENIEINELKIPAPLNDDAFDIYEYKLRDIKTIDSNKVFKIEVINTSEISPQFSGYIYIIDSLFALIKADLKTNDAAKLRFIDRLIFNQKFSAFKDKSENTFWMPTDVQIYADGIFSGLIKFKGEVFTIVSNYNLNKKAPKGIFDEYIVKILPNADKDSNYWNKNQLIRNTEEEKKAYKNIEQETKSREKSFRMSPNGVLFGKNYSSNVFSYYKFNRIEGSHLQFNLKYSRDINRIITDGLIGYGFSDKKVKYELNTSLRLLKDRSLYLSGSFYDKLSPLFINMNWLDYLYNTFTSLLDKQDKIDYYYSSGYKISVMKSIIPQIWMGLHYSQEKQVSAQTNTDYSFRKSGEQFRSNPEINEAFSRIIGVSLRFDLNRFKYIDWGTGEITPIRQTNFPVIYLKYEYSPKSLSSTYDFRKYSGSISGNLSLNSFINLRYITGGILMNGVVPYQNLATFNTSFSKLPGTMYFLANQYSEFLGDRLYYFNFENDFGKIIPGRIPFLKDFHIIGIFNCGRSFISDENKNLSKFKHYRSTDGLYTEAGFAIDRILDIYKLNFIWRLNNFVEGKNFSFTLSLEGLAF